MGDDSMGEIFVFRQQVSSIYYSVTGATGWLVAVQLRVGVRGWVEGCAKDSTHTRIIDRLKPTGELEDSCGGSKFWLQVARSA